MRLTFINSHNVGMIWRLLMLRRRAAVMLSVSMIAVYLCDAILPVITQHVVDIVLAKKNLDIIAALALIAATVVCIESRFLDARQNALAELAIFLDVRLARRLFSALFRRAGSGERFLETDVHEAFEAATTIRTFSTFLAPQLLFESGFALVAILVMLYYSTIVTVVFFACLILNLIWLRRGNGDTRGPAEEHRVASNHRRSVLLETLRGLDTLVALADEKAAYNRNISAVRGMADAHLKATRSIGRVSFKAVTSSRILRFVVLAVAIFQIYRNRLSFGDLLALELMSSRILDPCILVMTSYKTVIETFIAAKTVSRFLAKPIRRSRGRPDQEEWARGVLSLKKVCFRYPGSGRDAVKDVSLDLPTRGVVAIVGRNGSGKTTLARMIGAVAPQTSGDIVLGGMSYKDMDMRWMRARCGMALQESVLFTDTVRANLVGLRAIDDRQIEKALFIAGAEKLVREELDGIHGDLPDAGRRLSGGQRQRIAIARAVSRDPRIAVFDEPCSALDPEAALDLEDQLMTWGRQRLLVLVSHNLRITRHADVIAVMDEGRLIGCGKHDALLGTCAVYKSLWSDYTSSLN